MRLLRRYVELGSQDAFAEIVRKHLPWIYSTCRRALRDPHLAEDAAQAVFIVLARRAESISPETRLAGWLFNTARFVVKDAKKARSRYLRREEIARQIASAQTGNGRNGRHNGNGNGNGNGHGVGLDSSQQSLLDDGMSSLSERDRQALIMHFYEGLTLQQMAEALEIGKEGAKKRVARALSRLRKKLGTKGVLKANRTAGRAVLSIIALALLLRSQSTWAVPVGLTRRAIEAGAGGGALSGLGGGLAAWLADWSIGASARAAGRLFRAALAAEILAAVAVTMITVWPTRGPVRVTSGPVPSRPGSVHVAGGEAYPNTWVVTSRGTASTPASGETPLLVTTSNEPPYHSGADDPDEPVVQAAKPAPAPAPSATKSKTTGETAAKPVEGAGDEAPVMGSSYAGLPPVTRGGASAELAYEPPAPGPGKVESPQPPLPFGALGTGGHEGRRSAKQAKEKEVAAGTVRPGGVTVGGANGVTPPTPGTDGTISGDPTQGAVTGDPTGNGQGTGTAVVAGGQMVPPPPAPDWPGSHSPIAPGFSSPPLGQDNAKLDDPGMLARGHDEDGRSYIGKVKRMSADPDELVRIACDKDRKGAGRSEAPAGVKQAAWTRKRDRGGGSGPWMRLLDEDADGPLTIIGGRPVPREVLAGGKVPGDRPWFVPIGHGHGGWVGGYPAGFETPVFQQTPEPGGLAAILLAAGTMLARRRRRRGR
jgi:RNA polymerase sigma factor (sigma-70 family)